MGTGHVMINRVDNRSMMRCLLHCSDLLKQVGAAVCKAGNSWQSWVQMAAMLAAYWQVTSCVWVPAAGEISAQREPRKMIPLAALLRKEN